MTLAFFNANALSRGGATWQNDMGNSKKYNWPPHLFFKFVSVQQLKRSLFSNKIILGPFNCPNTCN